jgi:hypothetical protein
MPRSADGSPVVWWNGRNASFSGYKDAADAGTPRVVYGDSSALETNVHTHIAMTDLPVVPGATRHRDSSGQIDYWFMPLQTDGSFELIKVLPFSPSRLGVLVHSYKNHQDYLLTGMGDWLPASASENPGR